MAICFKLLPMVIWNTYGLLYKVPNLMTPFRTENGLIGLGIAFICIVGATFIVCRKELMWKPAQLMRPKAPKAGKRVLLERVTILWNHINFSRKVTIRNLFRYKKKALMTIIGIAGCTALTLSGFGLRDSITKIVTKQFGETYQYDGMIYIKENGNQLAENLKKHSEITEIVKITAETAEIKKEGIQKSTNIIIPEDKNEFEKMCTLYDREEKEVKLESGGIIITDKLAEMLKAEEGDKITLLLNDGKEYEFKIRSIVKNYINHYVYIAKEDYHKIVGEVDTNLLWINTIKLNQEEQNELAEKMLQDPNIASITMIDELIQTIEDMLQSLDYVIIILIVASAILALTVLYNLANVNISERKKEIATLKVLGFYDKEVDSYISRESIIFTIVGIVIGLVRRIFSNKLYHNNL